MFHAKETLRGLYDFACPQLTGTLLAELTDNIADTDCPPELTRLGVTLRRWHHRIINWHDSQVTNDPNRRRQQPHANLQLGCTLVE